MRRSIVAGLLIVLWASVMCVAQSETYPPAEPIAWWTADGHAADSVRGTPGSMEFGGGYTEGVDGQAFSLDGWNDSVVVWDPGIEFGEGADFSIAAWVNLQQPTANCLDVVLWFEDAGRIYRAGGTRGLSVALARDTHRVLLYITERTSYSVVESSNAVPLDSWVHIVCIREGGRASIYIDGILNATGDISTARIPAPEMITIGGIYDRRQPGLPIESGHGFGGLLDEILIYDRALTIDEVAELFSRYAPEEDRVGCCPVTLSVTEIRESGELVLFAASEGIPVDVDLVKVMSSSWGSPATLSECPGVTLQKVAIGAFRVKFAVRTDLDSARLLIIQVRDPLSSSQGSVMVDRS